MLEQNLNTTESYDNKYALSFEDEKLESKNETEFQKVSISQDTFS